MLEGFYFEEKNCLGILGILVDVFRLTFGAVTKTSMDLGKQHMKCFSLESRKVLETELVFRSDGLLTACSTVSAGGLWAEPHLGSVSRWFHGVGIWGRGLW